MISNLLDRRRFLILTGGAAVAALGAQALWQETAAALSLDPAPFTLGVASADPDAGSVALWTRLAVDPAAADGGMPAEPIEVAWEVAADEGFTEIIRDGQVQARPEQVHSVHVVADGLEPNTVVLVSVRRRRCDQPGRPDPDPAVGPAGRGQAQVRVRLLRGLGRRSLLGLPGSGRAGC